MCPDTGELVDVIDPHALTVICVSSYTTVNVSSYSYICVLIQASWLTVICVLIYCYICVLILLYMCPHTGELVDVIDPDALNAAVKRLKTCIVTALRPDFEAAYLANQTYADVC